ncbi:hypothetical protein ACH5RR_024774 [Cinchona calisaya]|uniref:Uncharacterized protein n=1 Tax=Cinchona calisaya TaxID=153742 RepID=A0ABD2Z1V3_9GENT
MADVDEIGTVIHSRDYPVDSIPDIIAHDLRGIAHFDVRLQVRYRWLSYPAAEMVDGSKVLYFEQVEMNWVDFEKVEIIVV